MKILAVDDERTMIMLYQDFFRLNKTDVVYSFDGFQAFKEVVQSIEENEMFDLILLDIEMPNIGGLECLKMIRDLEAEKNVKNCPIVIVTGSDELSDILLAFESKANAFIVKDNNIYERISEEIKNLLGIDISKSRLKPSVSHGNSEMKR